jgi:ribosomal 50S subunit-recycling heat shock protein
MRIDNFLVVSRLVKRRTLAQEFCAKSLVSVNGVAAKSSKEVKAGDQVAISGQRETTVVRIIDLPRTKQVAKENAGSLYETIRIEPNEEHS